MIFLYIMRIIDLDLLLHFEVYEDRLYCLDTVILHG